MIIQHVYSKTVRPKTRQKVRPKPKAKVGPKTVARPKAKVARPAAPPRVLQTGVLINPVTRNETPSKIGLVLARDGQALVPIVVSANASDGTRALATELQSYLQKMTGAIFDIQVGDGSEGIVLGTPDEFPTPALNKALEIRYVYDGKEAYAIRTREKKVLLLGATSQGLSHAMFRFLEEMGCRWFFTNDDWQIIPRTPNLKFALDITDRPTFLTRDIWYGWWFFDDNGHPGSTPDKPRNAQRDHEAWKRRNFLGASFTLNAGHSYEAIANANAALLKEHPEYWALVGDKRQGPQFELANPGARKMIVDYALDFFAKNPSADMVSVDPADGGGYSNSEESVKAGNPSDQVFDMANEVARAVEKAYPGQNKMVGLMAYYFHSDPPPFNLEPNVYVQLSTSFIGGKKTFDEIIEEWPLRTTNLGFYDYYSVWRWDSDLWPGGRGGSVDYLTMMIRRFHAANAKGQSRAPSISAESSNNWGLNGRSYYLTSKLMWNPDVDATAVLEDFYRKAFGSGAPEMKKYYALQDVVPPMSPGLLGTLYRHVNAASEATKNDEAVQKRLNDIKNYLVFDFWSRKVRQENDQNAKSALTEKIWALTYRTRYQYMNHWNAIRLDWINDTGAPDFPRPWKIDQPISHEEIEAWFQDGLKSYPVLKIPEEKKFSTELVAVDFGGKGNANSQYYQEGSSYAVLSVKGEPIKIKIDAGSAYGGLRHEYKILDSKGKVLLEGKPKADEKIEFAFKVPTAGIYYFNYSDRGAYGRVYWSADQIVSLPLKDRAFRGMELIAPMYFYVPKSTKEINYYYKRADWQFGGPHQISDSTGKVIQEVTLDGDYVSVPVPAGQAGKVWKIGGPQFGLGSFRFFNIPNYFSPNSHRMLLPKDIVAKDAIKKLM